jgi:hypothetical protein
VVCAQCDEFHVEEILIPYCIAAPQSSITLTRLRSWRHSFAHLFIKVMNRTVSPSSTFMTKMFKEDKNHTVIIFVTLLCFLYLVLMFFSIRLVLGDKSNEAPFHLSMISKKLLSAMNKLSMWELPVLLHMDGTLKFNENKFMVISLGVLDGAQLLHVMSLSLILHSTKEMYLRVVQGVKDIISDLFLGVPFLPNYLIKDAEHADSTALVSVFPGADTLMCLFHVIKVSKDKLSGNKYRDVKLKDITLLHMSLSQQEFDHKWTSMFNHWIVNSTSFAVYFQRQWVEGPFKCLVLLPVMQLLSIAWKALMQC